MNVQRHFFLGVKSMSIKPICHVSVSPRKQHYPAVTISHSTMGSMTMKSTHRLLGHLLALLTYSLIFQLMVPILDGFLLTFQSSFLCCLEMVYLYVLSDDLHVSSPLMESCVLLWLNISKS